jgi:hypothetical protein
LATMAGSALGIGPIAIDERFQRPGWHIKDGRSGVDVGDQDEKFARRLDGSW